MWSSAYCTQASTVYTTIKWAGDAPAYLTLFFPNVCEYLCTYLQAQGLPQWVSSKELASNAGDTVDACSVPGWGRWATHSSILENPMDRGAWWATVHGVSKSRTQLKWHSTQARWFPPRSLPSSASSCPEDNLRSGNETVGLAHLRILTSLSKLAMKSWFWKSIGR